MTGLHLDSVGTPLGGSLQPDPIGTPDRNRRASQVLRFEGLRTVLRLRRLRRTGSPCGIFPVGRESIVTDYDFIGSGGPSRLCGEFPAGRGSIGMDFEFVINVDDPFEVCATAREERRGCPARRPMADDGHRFLEQRPGGHSRH